MPTPAQIDTACRTLYVTALIDGKRRQIDGATANYHGDEAAPGNVHVHTRRTGYWEEVAITDVLITDQPFATKEKEMADPNTNLNIVDATAKKLGTGRKSGKRASDGLHAGPSTRKKGGDAATSLKDIKKIVGGDEKKEATAPAETTSKKKTSKKDSKPEKEKKPTVTVSRATPKQGELPTMNLGKRKIQEIEDLADVYEEKMLDLKRATDARDDAKENLIISLKKHKRQSYSRKTWASVEIVGSERIKFKRDKGSKNDE